MYPHERSLVKNFKDQPFVIIGVNSDKDREKLKAVLEKEEITWRSFWNGGSTRGPISAAWNIHGWPTLYILDAKGVIRYKSLGGNEAEIDKMLEELMAEMKSGSK